MIKMAREKKIHLIKILPNDLHRQDRKETCQLLLSEKIKILQKKKKASKIEQLFQ